MSAPKRCAKHDPALPTCFACFPPKPSAPEPVAWLEAGVRITMDRRFAEEWVLDGAVVTPLYPGPMTEEWGYQEPGMDPEAMDTREDRREIARLRAKLQEAARG